MFYINIIDDNNRLQHQLHQTHQLLLNVQDKLDRRIENEKQNNVLNRLNDERKKRLEFEAAKISLARAYKFNEQYDGSPGLTALQFRQSIIIFDKKVRILTGEFYNEKDVVSEVRNAFIGNAKELVGDENPQLITNLDEFLKWFDESFDLSGLREKLHDNLINWTINKNENILSIVQRYKTKLKLFDLTYNICSDEIKAATYLSPKMMVQSIIKSIRIAKSELNDAINNWIYFNKRNPKDLSELNDMLHDINQINQALNATKVNIPKNPVVEHAVNMINSNDILAEFKSNNELNKSNNNDINNNSINPRSTNTNQSNYNSLNQYNNNSNYQSNYNNYNQNNNNRFRGRGRGRGRGRQFARGRGRGRASYNTPFNNGMPIFYKGKCNKCHKLGHWKKDCNRMNKFFKELIEIYEKQAQFLQNKNNNNQVNITTQTKQREKSTLPDMTAYS